MFGPLARDLVDDVLFIDAFFLIHDWELLNDRAEPFWPAFLSSLGTP